MQVSSSPWILIPPSTSLSSSTMQTNNIMLKSARYATYIIQLIWKKLLLSDTNCFLGHCNLCAYLEVKKFGCKLFKHLCSFPLFSFFVFPLFYLEFLFPHTLQPPLPLSHPPCSHSLTLSLSDSLTSLLPFTPLLTPSLPKFTLLLISTSPPSLPHFYSSSITHTLFSPSHSIVLLSLPPLVSSSWPTSGHQYLSPSMELQCRHPSIPRRWYWQWIASLHSMQNHQDITRLIPACSLQWQPKAHRVYQLLYEMVCHHRW